MTFSAADIIWTPWFLVQHPAGDPCLSRQGRLEGHTVEVFVDARVWAKALLGSARGAGSDLGAYDFLARESQPFITSLLKKANR